MSVKRRKAGLVISWNKSLSILTPWRKGKSDTVLDSEVVLTKLKLFSTFHERLLMSDDSVSTISTVSEQDLNKPSEVNPTPNPQVESGSDYLSSIFSDSQLPRLYKFESEDSGVELPSGANSPSTPTGSEQSFVVHSRESSCDSANLNSESTGLTEPLQTHEQGCEGEPVEGSVDTTQLRPGGELRDSDSEDDVDKCGTSGNKPGGDEQMCEEPVEPVQTDSSRHRSTVNPTEEGLRRRSTSDSLDHYMDECCRLSEAQETSSQNPLGSGLGYLEHICQLLEKIGQLQETNLRLQRQICGLQKDGRVTKTKEDFFQQHCSCGAAGLAFQDIHKRQSTSECLSPTGTLSDLSTIPEVSCHPLISATTDLNSEGFKPIPVWRRGLNRRSYTEGEVRFLGSSTEGLCMPQRRLSDNYSWGRVKDLVKRSKLRNQSRLEMSSSSLKMSCPQLYRPDLGPVEPAVRNRNSMIALGHHSKLDFSWLQ